MGWSWKIGRIAGIDVFVHFTFLLLLAFIGIVYYREHRDIAEALLGVAVIIILFGIVVLHELGHALAARRYGIATRDITLLPIGGVARLERMPEDPKQELVVAIAGPAVNVALAAAALAVMAVLHRMPQADEAITTEGSLLAKFFYFNVMLVLFNLLPAFPMDGGRVLRALLAMRMDYVRATQVAAWVGKAMAIVFGFLGLFGGFSPLLIFIALFVWVGAGQEASMAKVRSALHGLAVQNAMITDFRTLQPDDTLQTAAGYVAAGYRQDFPVVEGELPVGILTLKDLASALGQQSQHAQHGPQPAVADVMQRQFATAAPQDMLVAALSRLQNGAPRAVPVVQDGRLIGLLTADSLTQRLMVEQARQQGADRQ